MESFFDIMPETDTLVKPKAVKTVREVEYSCESCGLYKQCDSPKMVPMGNVNSKLLVVIDSPSRLADRRHKVASGETLEVLKELCASSGIEFSDICVINAIQCRHSVLNKSTIPVCRNRLKTFINDHNFESVVAMGVTAMTVLFGNSTPCGEMAKLENNAIPLLDCSTIVYPTYSVHDFVVEKRNNVILLKMGQAFRKAIRFTSFVNYQTLADERIHILSNTKDIIAGITEMIDSPLVKSFDYEATGLQPYRKGHEVICMSIATIHKSIVFLLTPEIKEIVTKFLQSDTSKVAHNAKFEMIWSKALTGRFPEGIVADTMINAHCINNTKGITSLKYQSFLHFGIIGYDDDIKYLWESNEDTIHAFNQLYYYKKRGELHLIADKLLTYCAYDSLFTAWLYEAQLKAIATMPHIATGIKLFMDATKVFADTEYRGMKIDVVAVERNLKEVGVKLEVMHEILYETPEVALWDKPTPFNHASPPDLSHLLYTIMGCTPTKFTKKEQPSTDAEALEKLGEIEPSEFLDVLLKYRKLEKIKSTYLDGIQKNTLDNYIHPSFNFNVVPTFRSSSSGAISFQNLPKRNKSAKRYIRSTFIPDKNTFLEELDFSSLEVNIGACLHKDPQMLEYLAHPELNNMHTDTAYDLFLRTEKDLLEEERQATKGGFTFSQQFGSYYVNCAKTLWDTMPKESKIHLASKGYKTLRQYTLLVMEAERVFWEERFGVFGKWREANYKRYLKTGYIDFNTGFRSTTFRTRNQVHNIETQGSAFHCLLSLYLRIDARLKELKMDTRLTGQVHDSIVACVVPAEEDFFHIIVKECLQDLTNEWKWIIVPLELKYEQAEVGEPWNKMAEKGAIRSR